MTGERAAASIYDLFVMNGNGCFPRLIMRNVSGSPAWSKNWQKIAIGCENNTSLCILDAWKTLNDCTIAGEYTEGACTPVVLAKYPLPPEISDSRFFHNISWSPDDLQIAINGRKIIYILSLTNEGQWEILPSDDYYSSGAEWAPNSDLIATAGIFLIDTTDATKTKLVEGVQPQWSPDGTRLAYLTHIDENQDNEYEYWGIAEIDIMSLSWQWLYEAPGGNQVAPQIPYDIGDFGGHRELSWSPDEGYLAVASRLNHDNDQQIFRLNISTREIIVLTADLIFNEGDGYCSAPAWGPKKADKD
jgi:Tol biopolymer transport system component